MADSGINKNGKTIQFSFEDFVLLPLFLVLIFLSLKICFKKLKRKQERQQDKCVSRTCIRCKGNESFALSHLLAKLDKFVSQRRVQDDSLARLRTSILEYKGKAGDFESVSQRPTVLHLLHLCPARPIHSLCSDASLVLGAQFDIAKIKEELIGILNKDYLWSYNETKDGIWKLYYLYNQGIKQGSNCDSCPETTRMVCNTPSFMKNVPFGNAAFSLLSPGASISGHYGSTNVRLRCHITLFQGSNCILSVGNEKVVYDENQVILFDDSFEHSVSHEKGGNSNRVILMLDLWHPEVTELEKDAIRYVYDVSV